MIVTLRVLFVVVLASMLGVTAWASLQQPLGDFVRGGMMREPWVIATLVDAYWAFLTFYVWVAWKERSLGARLLWFVAVILLGNIAMAAYMLRELTVVPADARLDEVFTRRNAGTLPLPALLTLAAAAVYALA